MMRKRLAALLLAACLLPGLCGCYGDLREESSYTYTLGVVLKTQDAEHWKEIRSGMEHAANERGVRLILQYPSDETAEGEQDVMLRDMAGQPIDALLFAPCNSYDTAWLADLTAEAGIPLFTVDTAAFDTALPYIGSDNRHIGQMAYEYLLDTLEPGASIGIITGTPQQASLSDRVSSMQEACARDGVLTVARTDSDCNSYKEAYAAAWEQMRSTHVSAIFCTSGVLGLGAVSAKEDLRRTDVRIIAVDTQDDALNAVQTGRLDALITQDGYDIGYQAVAAACDALAGAPVSDGLYMENELLTKGNISAFLQARGGEERYE